MQSKIPIAVGSKAAVTSKKETDAMTNRLSGKVLLQIPARLVFAFVSL
jgi:hypothetical protein